MRIVCCLYGLHFPYFRKGLRPLRDGDLVIKPVLSFGSKQKKTYAINQSSFLPEDSFESFWGLGYWTRSNAELCLLAKKGSISRQSKSVHQLIYDPVREHSRKPDSTRDKIVELVGDLPRIELFARQRYNGWDAWGNEI